MKKTQKPKTKNRKPHLLTQEEWEAMYQAWKRSESGPSDLARKGRCSRSTVTKYIKDGLPGKGWPSFRTRLKMENAVEAEKSATPEPIVDEYQKCRQENLQVLRALRAGITRQVQKMIEAAQKSQELSTEQLHRLAQALESCGRSEAFWLNTPESLTAKEVERVIDYVNEHNGEIPPGMTTKAFLDMIGELFGVLKKNQ
jgi:transcriptional regulator with XRE-family HTH domain